MPKMASLAQKCCDLCVLQANFHTGWKCTCVKDLTNIISDQLFREPTDSGNLWSQEDNDLLTNWFFHSFFGLILDWHTCIIGDNFSSSWKIFQDIDSWRTTEIYKFGCVRNSGYSCHFDKGCESYERRFARLTLLSSVVASSFFVSSVFDFF